MSACCPLCGAAQRPIFELVKVAIEDLCVEMSTVYKYHGTGKWTWIHRPGRHLVMDLLAAATFFEQTGHSTTAAKLRARARRLSAGRSD